MILKKNYVCHRNSAHISRTKLIPQKKLRQEACKKQICPSGVPRNTCKNICYGSQRCNFKQRKKKKKKKSYEITSGFCLVFFFFVWSLLWTSQNKASVFVQSPGILLFLAPEKILLKHASGHKLQLELVGKILVKYISVLKYHLDGMGYFWKFTVFLTLPRGKNEVKCPFKIFWSE